MTEKIKIMAVVGPTASGKSALAVQLAKCLNGEILSCDSMQIYKGMDIGTAKPSRAEQEGVAHHLLDIVAPEQAFSCAEYVQRAGELAKEVFLNGKLPIFCGGTGLYLDGVLRGGGFEETQRDPALRQELLDYATKHGNHALHDRLKAVDPDAAAAIHENNVKRVVRALEIYQSTGITKTEMDRRSKLAGSPYDATVIGLCFADRSLLYERIDRRVDAMLSAGLLEETEKLYRSGVFDCNATAAQAIGYKELLGVIRNECLLSDAVEELKRATRRYAKRQMTWFGAKPYVKWIQVDANGALRGQSELIAEALELISK